MFAFQSTHPQGVRRGRNTSPPGIFLFQSTHPQGVRRRRRPKRKRQKRFQSTHPQGVRRCQVRDFEVTKTVSIHAPAGGATFPRFRGATPLTGFNPRTRRGCDDGGQSCFRRQNSFQSTHPQGVRHRIHQGVFDASGVSIHAPAGGATAIAMIGVIMESMFQSTHPQGVRLGQVERVYADMLFQSTHPQGVRRVGHRLCCRVSCVSIHAPAGGATHLPIMSTTHFFRFQSTHPQGVRPAWQFAETENEISFNPRTRRGCDRTQLFWLSKIHRFNPRTRRGCDS